MRKVDFPRPLTHNLLQNLLDRVKGKVHQLVIHTLKEETFHAYLLIQTQDEVFYLDCRPSDGMILATLLSTPIFMSPEAIAKMAEIGIVADLQPAWLERDGATLLKQFGEARLSYFQPYKSLQEAGVIVGGGSDHMQKIGGMRSINPYNPFFGMWVTLQRQPRWTESILHPKQRLTREEAIRLFFVHIWNQGERVWRSDGSTESYRPDPASERLLTLLARDAQAPFFAERAQVRKDRARIEAHVVLACHAHARTRESREVEQRLRGVEDRVVEQVEGSIERGEVLQPIAITAAAVELG